MAEKEIKNCQNCKQDFTIEPDLPAGRQGILIYHD